MIAFAVARQGWFARGFLCVYWNHFGVEAKRMLICLPPI